MTAGRPRTIRRRVHPVVEALRAARLARNVTIVQLAQELGYTKDSISKWERGAMSPLLQHLSDWCEALGMELVARKEKP